MAIKTLHLTNAYHPTSGGIRTFYAALLRAANEERRHMRLVVPGEDDGVAEVGEYGRIYTVRAGRAPAFDRRYRMMLPTAYLPPSRSAVVRILEREQPDLVEICDKYALPYLAALLRRGWMPAVPRPTLVGLSCERLDDNLAAFVTAGSGGRRFARWYLRHIYGPPFDAHIANSDYTAAELRQALWDRSPSFIRVCAMGVDFQQFGPAHANRRLRRTLLEETGAAPDDVLVLYVGRLSPEKNPWLLVDMMERLGRPARGGATTRDYRLLIAGDGPAAAALVREAAKRAPGRIRTIGAVTDRARLAELYASADVFVHPNPREPFGIGPLEAMASRVPVVLPATGGVLSYASPVNAWLAAPDGSSFAFAVRSAVERPDDSRLVAARETARQHDWSRAASAYFRTLDDIRARHLRGTARPVLPSDLRLRLA